MGQNNPLIVVVLKGSTPILNSLEQQKVKILSENISDAMFILNTS